MRAIKAICVKTFNDGSDIAYTVGNISGVTRIVETTKCGMQADIPYLEVYKGDELIAELCQHNVESVHFYTAEEWTKKS